MNKIFFLILSVVIMGCGSEPVRRNIEEQDHKISQDTNTPQVIYYEGNGGKDIRFAVLPLTGNNLTENEKWILSFVEGNFVSDFNKYSAMIILDRQNIEKILQAQQEGLDLLFSDETQSDVGHMINSQYNLYGSITKVSVNNYSIEFSISNTDTGIRKASYPPRLCSLNELQSLNAIKEASQDLLHQMGVMLTDDGISALRSNVQQNIINADIALSKGIVAQRSGTVIEALSYYYDAIGFDTSSVEANTRLSALANEISSGNIGENVRNDIQRRNEWVKITKDAELFFNTHLPYEIIYNTGIWQGDVNYNNETVDLLSTIRLEPSNYFQAFDTLLDGLEVSGKRIEWGFEFWPLFSNLFTEYHRSSNINDSNTAKKIISINIDLINSFDKIIATTEEKLINTITFKRGKIIDGEHSYNYGHIIGDRRTGDYYHVDTSRIEVTHDVHTIIFQNVNANDITDNLIMKITKIDGISIDKVLNNGYIKITSGEL